MYSYCFAVQQHYFPRLCPNTFFYILRFCPFLSLRVVLLFLVINYRGIALSSIFGKLFDNIVLHRYHEMLCTSDLQFAFKKKSSTNLCTMVLKEIIPCYIHNDSSAFCTF